MMQVLVKKTKNNPLLLGEPGVGKTAIVEGLARMIAVGDVPDSLRDKRVILMDMASLLAGTKFRGEFEERLKSFIEEVTSDKDNIILFIDEGIVMDVYMYMYIMCVLVHTVVGSGHSGEQGMDAATILKPALARGELHCIGATTRDEYRKHIQKVCIGGGKRGNDDSLMTGWCVRSPISTH